MSDRTAPQYSALEQLLHWATAALVLPAFFYGPGGSEERMYAAARDGSRRLHETLGLSVRNNRDSALLACFRHASGPAGRFPLDGTRL